MENEIIFIVCLWITFIITRFWSYKFHDYRNYNKVFPGKSKAKTLTGWLRRKTYFDWHHFHIGIILFLIGLVIFKIQIIISIIFLGIGTSLFFDQLLPILDFGNYFSKEMFLNSLIFHIIATIIIF
jgi:hypothetical protein